MDRPLSDGSLLALNVDAAFRRLTDVMTQAVALIHPSYTVPPKELFQHLLPTNSQDFISYLSIRSKSNPPSQLQSLLSQCAYKHILHALEGRAGADGRVADSARWRAIQADHAGDWLRVTPTDEDLRLADSHWMIEVVSCMS